VNEIIDFEGEMSEEDKDMPSKRHSLTQTNITVFLGNDERVTTFVELSLDSTSTDLSQFGIKNKDEVIPDISVYLESPSLDDEPGEDEVRVTKMPDLAIEVLSPTQTINELLKKIKAYFALGIRSCWLVMPALEEVRVFSQQLRHYKNFDINNNEIVVDEVMDIRLPIQKVFRRRFAKVLNKNT
jgi:Uma2 family endonuclease